MNALPEHDTAACEECGYSLAGRIMTPGASTCPECGNPFYPATPWRGKPLAPRWVLIPMFCAPLTVLLILFLVGVAFRQVLGGAALPLLLLWLVLAVAFGISWPLGFAHQLAQQSVARRERG